MSHNDDGERIEIVLTDDFHPYEDKTLTESQPEQPIVTDREPFNDMVKHGDIIAGYQRNRTLSDYPRRMRPWVRLYAIAILVLLVGSLIMPLIHEVGRW